MSRFHDEFFKQKGTEHDKLLITCVSRSGLEKILDRIKPVTRCENFIKMGGNYKIWDPVEGTRVERENTIINLDEDYETEVICKNGNFIIGYADIVYTVLVTSAEDRDSFCLPHRYQCVIEVKPKFDDAGAILWQLKTYADILGTHAKEYHTHNGFNVLKGTVVPGNLVIVTYTDVPSDTIEYLAHEGVDVIKF